MRVLVVDDSAPVRRRLLAMLRDVSGVRAFGVRNAAQMRRRLRRDSADVVVLDVHVAGTSGLELIGDVRRDAPGATVIVLTNEANELYRRACLEREVQYFFDKSRDFERAVALVAELAVRTNLPNV